MKKWLQSTDYKKMSEGTLVPRPIAIYLNLYNLGKKEFGNFNWGIRDLFKISILLNTQYMIGFLIIS